MTRSRFARSVAAAFVALAVVAATGSSAAAQAGEKTAKAPAFDVTEATISQLQAALADGGTTSVALVDAYLARIAAYDTHGPTLNALLRLNPNAHAEAAALDAERKQGHVRGPLHGIPIVVKANYGTVEGPTSAGSLAMANSMPGRDAFVVKQLRAAGAIIIGKTNMHELAAGITSISSLGGQTRNAYDPARCPGGSSGGTGVAVASSFAAVGWGSDTCGSIRIPAAFGSLFGLRMTQGMASRAGIVPLSHTQDIPGPLARTVTDLAIALDATIGPDPDDPDTRVLQGRALPHFVDSLSKDALHGARIGLLTNYVTGGESTIADTVRAAVRSMRALGATIVDVRMPTLDSLLNGTSVINMETKFDLIEYFKTVPNAPVHSLHDILASGLVDEQVEGRLLLPDTVRSADSEAYRAALAKRAALHTALVALLDSLHLDALAYPTMREGPAIIGDAQSGSTCGLSAQSGLPAITEPGGFTSDGLPVGVELLGRPFSDAHLVAMAYAFEQAGPRRRPPTITPSLVTRVVAQRDKFGATARGMHGLAKATFMYDGPSRELTYDVNVTDIPATQIDAVVLRRVDSTGVEWVIHRLAGPGKDRGQGRFTLTPKDQRALVAGQLRLALLTTAGISPGTEATLELPALKHQ
ncbi:MAG TPA: amidase family protein [Gemmatimonadaceae bacterium]|jgi:Asp-tRNA(Asn)/Glu-tRNA(Gln) amidotransferase A subunit family amidase